MAKGERYYWIKLKKSFLTSEKVDFLLSQANGSDYVVIYQMLCLKTINTGGELFSQIGEVIIPYDIPKIQRDLKHFSVDTITVALELFKRLGMVYIQENGILKITEFAELVGSETDYAEQKRLQRQKVDKGVDKLVDNVHTEYRDKSIENIELELQSRKTFKDLKEDRPNYEEVLTFFHNRGLTTEADDFLKMMEKNEWKTKSGEPVKEWKGIATNYIKQIKGLREKKTEEEELLDSIYGTN